MKDILTREFCEFSAKLGNDPLRIQSVGGNTSIKRDGVMWIKASGMELSQALKPSVFVAVDIEAAKSEISGSGDGSCKNTLLDPDCKLRPSIETTFHAALDWPVVAHTHSVATLVHVICPEGLAKAKMKLEDLSTASVPYVKPGLKLTQAILEKITKDTRVILLENHGLICCGKTVGEAAKLMDEVETRLDLKPQHVSFQPQTATPSGYSWSPESWIARNEHTMRIATAGSYYPDHVVFLGSALPIRNNAANPPVILQPGEGVMIRNDATPPQRAMLKCLSDILVRLPTEWSPKPIGTDAEADLLNWDAEKYRQKLSK